MEDFLYWGVVYFKVAVFGTIITVFVQVILTLVKTLHDW